MFALCAQWGPSEALKGAFALHYHTITASGNPSPPTSMQKEYFFIFHNSILVPHLGVLIVLIIRLKKYLGKIFFNAKHGHTTGL